MQLFRSRFLLPVLLLCLAQFSARAQGFSFNCARDTIVPGCPANLCFTLKSLLPNPHKSANNYVVNATGELPSCLLASANPGIPGAPTTLNVDDRYSPAFPIGFPFVFFGTPYSNLVVSSNGYLSFDVALANTYSHWNIMNGGTPQNLPSTFYDRALIMGPYHDIDIGITTSPNRLISYQTAGLAPYRRWILNYYKIPLFSGACNSLFENTHQIILYESTGIIDVNIFDKQICLGWNQGRAMIGVQDYNRTTGVMVPGRRATDPPWGSIGMNESYRFVPVGGTPLFRRVELYDLAGTLLTTGTTTVVPSGDLEASFPNICPPAGSTTTYVIKAFYEKIDDPTAEVFAVDTVNVNRGQGLAASATSTQATCAASNGSIRVNTTTGGTPPYEYSLDGITWQSSNIFSNLPAGPYTVYIRDAGGVCTAQYNVTVGQVAGITATTSTSAAACTGVNNGSIVISTATGSGPYTFSLDGAPFVSGALPYTFSNVAAGSHTIVVQDVNGCVTNTINVTVATGTGVTASATSTAASCNGAANGTITVTASSGRPPYAYQLNGGPPQASNVFTGLNPGTYTITVTDALGCTRTFTRTVSAGTVLSASAVPVATSCSGASNGTVTITPTSGTGPYSFLLDGTLTQTGATSTTFSNLSSGSHTVVVTDQSTGCASNIITFNVSAGPVLTASAAPAATSCSGAANGSITVTPTNGTGPYSFSLDGGPFTPGAAPYTFSNLSAGVHTIQVQEIATGCITTLINATVNAGPVMTTSATKTDALCNGGATGSITVAQPAVGTAPFEYSLDNVNWQVSNVFTGLIAGTYTVYYREANGCANSLTIIVDEPATLTAADANTPVICNGQSNGTITVTPAGGVTPYEYSIDGGANWQSSNLFTVPAGPYTILVRDTNGCTVTRTVTVTEPAALIAASVNSNASCDGGNDGVITVNANGGNSGGYEYSIDGTNFQTSNTFNVAPGTYTITVRDNQGCNTSFTTVVGLSNNLSFTPQTDPYLCEGRNTQLSLVSNATGYLWTPSAGLSDTTIYNPVANPTVTTQYVVTATLGRCNATDTVVVNVYPAPVPDAGPDGFICYGQTYTLQGSGGTIYAWTPSTYLNNTTGANPVSTPQKDITYTVSIVSDVNGCASLVTDQVNIDVTPPIKIKTYPFDTIGYPGDQFQILAVASDPDVSTFVWTPATGLSNPNIPNPVLTVGQIGDDRVYQVIGSTVAGCKGEAYVNVKVYKGPEIYVATGFTPNGDGRNDRLTPFPVGIKTMNYFRVYNRWGQQVFATNRLHDGWDGKIAGTDQASGIYVWMIEVVTNDGRTVNRKGTTTLIR